MTRGVVKLWDTTRGFGFVAADDGGGDYFIHRTQLRVEADPAGWPPNLRVGDLVEFTGDLGPRGLRALDVRRADPVGPVVRAELVEAPVVRAETIANHETRGAGSTNCEPSRPGRGRGGGADRKPAAAP